LQFVQKNYLDFKKVIIYSFSHSIGFKNRFYLNFSWKKSEIQVESTALGGITSKTEFPLDTSKNMLELH
jgi:hypothetical protein